MPNWVINNARISGKKEEVDKFVDLVKGESSPFDFEKVIPMPSDIFRGNLGAKERELYGRKNWYDWSIENWGTKWNACDAYVFRYDDEHVNYEFQTAWSFPEFVWLKLVNLFPTLLFEVKYADEDLGYNCGAFYSDESSEGYYWFEFPDDEDDAFSFACDVWGYDEEEMVKYYG